MWFVLPGTRIFITNREKKILRSEERKQYKVGSELTIYNRIMTRLGNFSIGVLS